MGVCFSKKKDKNSLNKIEKSKPIEGSRDPPPTESPQEEEKVKEVLSETPKLVAIRSNVDETIKRSRSKGNDEEKSTTPTPSESTATTTTLGFRGQSKAEEEGGMIEKKKTKMRSRSQSPAKLSHKRTNSRSSDCRDLPVAVASDSKKREMRAFDVGCRNARSSPSPLKERTISSSKRDAGERSGKRSASPASINNNNKMRALTMAKGQCCPPAKAMDLGGPSFRGGQDGNNAPSSAPHCSGGEEAEESLENPLVSMECFIFL